MQIVNIDLIQAAHGVAYTLLEKARKTSKGIYWETLHYDNDLEEYIYQVAEDIYAGNAGIILFLLELYNVHRDEELANAIKQALSWLTDHCMSKEPDTYAFYTGRSGVAFVLVKAHAILEDPAYLESAIALLDHCEDAIDKAELRICDLLNGKAGLLLCLLHIYQHCGHETLLPKIERFTINLLEQFHFGKQTGMYWDRSGKQLDGLCGLSHGAAGLGFVFSELAFFFNDPWLLGIARQAYRYEDAYFDSKLKNWPDNRRVQENSELRDEYLNAYRNNDLHYFTAPRFMAAWCHGAPGIGLTRLHMYQRTGDGQYLRSAQDALATTLLLNRTSHIESNFSLCHGAGGNLFMLKMFAGSGMDDRAYILSEAAAMALEQKERMGRYLSGLRRDCPYEDISLFNGIAGVGYFYLFCNPNAELSRNILLPALPAKRAEEAALSIPRNKLLFGRLYPKTLMALSLLDEQLDRTLEALPVDTSVRNLKKAIRDHMKQLVKPYLDQAIIKDVFRYENKCISLDEQQPANAWLHTAELSQQEMLSRFSRASLQEAGIRLSPYSTLVQSKWPWAAIHKPADIVSAHSGKGRVYYTVLRSTAGGVQQVLLESLSAAVINNLPADPATIPLIVQRTAEQFPAGNDTTLVEQRIGQQVLELIKASILLLN